MVNQIFKRYKARLIRSRTRTSRPHLVLAMHSNATADSTSAGPRRRTQRRPLACRACTRSKVRCDKTVPCSRCRKRGIACEREDVQLSTKYAKNQVVGSQDDDGTRVGADVGDVMILDRESRLLPSTDFQNTTSGSRHISPSSPSDGPDSQTVHVAAPLRDIYGKQAEFEDLATAVEGLAWGRHQCHRYPHHDCLQVESLSALNCGKVQSYKVTSNHPPPDLAQTLVDFHVRVLAWTHNVLHVPTFQIQCERFWQSSTVENIQWLATYYAVLTSSAWTLQNSQTSLSLPEVGRDYARELFDLMMTTLNETRFASQHSIYSVQAICIAGLVANVLGESDLLTVSVNASVRIAQCLGLHRIGSTLGSDPPEIVIAKEVGRRVWWKLVEMDQHSMPYTGSCCINMQQLTTARPLNCNDGDLLDQPESMLTSSSYSLIMINMAVLIPTLLDGLWNLQDNASRYEHVINMDRRMRSLVANIPSAILRSNGTVPYEPEWLPLARRTLAIAAADKVRSNTCALETCVGALTCVDHNDTQVVSGPKFSIASILVHAEHLRQRCYHNTPRA